MSLGNLIKDLEALPQEARIVIRAIGNSPCQSCSDPNGDPLPQLPKDGITFYYPEKKVYCYQDDKWAIYEDDEVPEFFHAYRGYYRDIALSVTRKNNNYTVGDILTEANRANGFSFEGYKGGFFPMNENSNLWVAKWGEDSGLRYHGLSLDVNKVYIDVNKVYIDVIYQPIL